MPLFATAGAVVSGDTTPHAKPHPEPLLEAARRMGVAPERCIYVGDDERDIVAGRAAGMGTVAATYGYLGATADTATWGADADDRIRPLALLQSARTGLKYAILGLHWFRRGFGIAAVHVELNALVKQIQTN